MPNACTAACLSEYYAVDLCSVGCTAKVVVNMYEAIITNYTYSHNHAVKNGYCQAGKWITQTSLDKREKSRIGRQKRQVKIELAA